jgi:DNA-binding NarL/FixJ family response regulator
MSNMNDATTQAIPPPTGTAQATSDSPEAAAPTVRVWLVDDNDELRAMVADLLTRYGGIECARHFSSPDALLSELASKPGPDVILLDVQMGDRNGLDAVRPIKSLTRSTRVLMFTTCYNPEWRARALGDGASGYLLKTEAIENVAARIRSPAGDSVPKAYPHRRANCSAAALAQRHAVQASNSPRLLIRTLKALRALWN